ncbi:MAG: glucose-1-phosphate cytidylyltransferase [Roseinatronobacter sp.]
MKAVILAGGKGTRITEESRFRPKPMIEIGPYPIIWHIMKIYAAHGITDFIICCGYKGFVIKEYFASYYLRHSDVTFDMARNEMQVHRSGSEPWRVTIVDTGLETMTGGRLKRIAGHLDDQPFCMTYGDGLADIDLTALLAFHNAHGRLATMTTIPAEGRYGTALLDEVDRVSAFQEKSRNGTWINGGFFVLDPRVLERIEGDATPWELEPLRNLVSAGELMAYRHEGFWMAMDHLREKEMLDQMWHEGRAPWKVWE